MSVDAKKTTQVEYLTQLSSTENIQKHLVSVRKGLEKQYGSGDFTPCETFRTIYPQMLRGEEAVHYLRAGVATVLDAIKARTGDENAQILAVASLLAGAYADGFKYAASLLDSAADEVIN